GGGGGFVSVGVVVGGARHRESEEHHEKPRGCHASAYRIRENDEAAAVGPQVSLSGRHRSEESVRRRAPDRARTGHAQSSHDVSNRRRKTVDDDRRRTWPGSWRAGRSRGSLADAKASMQAGGRAPGRLAPDDRGRRPPPPSIRSRTPAAARFFSRGCCSRAGCFRVPAMSWTLPLALVLGWAPTASPAEPPTPPPNEALAASSWAEAHAAEVVEFVLPNGLTVVLSEAHDRSQVFGAIVVRTGSRDDPADHTGMAHYLEHMLFKGTQRLGTVDYGAEEPKL